MTFQQSVEYFCPEIIDHNFNGFVLRFGRIDIEVESYILCDYDDNNLLISTYGFSCTNRNQYEYGMNTLKKYSLNDETTLQ